MKTIKIFFLLFAVSICMASSCDVTNSDTETADAQEKLQAEATAQAGLPAIHNFQEKKLVKQIYEMRDDANLVCYAYLWNEFNGKMIYIGKCLGFGIPYSTQYSNPEKIIKFSGSSLYAGNDPQTMPQAEPNGLFMPASADATWLMLLDSAGVPHPTYFEPKVIVSTFKFQLQ